MFVVLQALSWIRLHRRFNRWLLAFLFVAGFVLLAHGCHGDGDHEL
jgi:hypothetical protein